MLAPLFFIGNIMYMLTQDTIDTLKELAETVTISDTQYGLNLNEYMSADEAIEVIAKHISSHGQILLARHILDLMNVLYIDPSDVYYV